MNCLMFWAHCKNGKNLTKHQVYNKGISSILGSFSKYKILISFKGMVDSEWNDVINYVVSCSIAELFIHREITKSRLQSTKSHTNISTTVHATTKLFLPFFSTQDGDSTDINCLVFWAHCQSGKFLTKHQVYNKGIFINLGNYEILISLEYMIDSEWNNVINFDASCSVAKLFIRRNHKI